VELAEFGTADCIAEACGKKPKSAGVEASKKNRTIRFTATLLREVPGDVIESQVSRKVAWKYKLAVRNSKLQARGL